MLWAETIPRKTVTLDGGGTAAIALYVGSFEGMEQPPAPPAHSYAAEPTAGVVVLTVALSAGASWTLPAAQRGLLRSPARPGRET